MSAGARRAVQAARMDRFIAVAEVSGHGPREHPTGAGSGVVACACQQYQSLDTDLLTAMCMWRSHVIAKQQAARAAGVAS